MYGENMVFGPENDEPMKNKEVFPIRGRKT